MSALFTRLQLLLPTHPISRLMHALTRVRIGWFKNGFIGVFSRGFNVDMRDAARPDPQDYTSFNDFFTRELREGARPLAGDHTTLISPVDGTVACFGDIDGDTLLQAKGRQYSLGALLGEGSDWERFRGGKFLTIYLAPYNYHRMHMPLGGELTVTRLVPGRLFSVNNATANAIDNLYGRNERVVCEYQTPTGPFAMVMVGALCVGSVATPWLGEITPGGGRRVREWHPGQDHPAPAALARGDETGRFNMGSTVVLTFAPGAARFAETLAEGRTVRMGEALGQLKAR